MGGKMPPEYFAAWRERNREKLKAYAREHYQANKDHIRARNKAWETANHEKVRAYRAAWAREHPRLPPPKDIQRAYNARYVMRHKAHVMWNNMRKRALALGRPFELTKEMVADMLAGAVVCPILGIPLEHSTGQAKFNSPSFDCFYPERGYVPGNVNVISWRANMIKSVASLDEIHAVARWMEGIIERSKK